MENQTQKHPRFEDDSFVFNWKAKEDARTKLEYERNLKELGIEIL